jgi:hypothetical protein
MSEKKMILIIDDDRSVKLEESVEMRSSKQE